MEAAVNGVSSTTSQTFKHYDRTVSMSVHWNLQPGKSERGSLIAVFVRTFKEWGRGEVFLTWADVSSSRSFLCPIFCLRFSFFF